MDSSPMGAFGERLHGRDLSYMRLPVKPAMTVGPRYPRLDRGSHPTGHLHRHPTSFAVIPDHFRHGRPDRPSPSSPAPTHPSSPARPGISPMTYWERNSARRPKPRAERKRLRLQISPVPQPDDEQLYDYSLNI